MRITEHERDVIVDAVKNVDADAKVWLFGSRTDDSKKGGDIDIAILSEKIKKDVMQEIGDSIKMNQIYIDILRENINVLNLSADWVKWSYEQVGKIGKEDNYSAEVLSMNIK